MRFRKSKNTVFPKLGDIKLKEFIHEGIDQEYHELNARVTHPTHINGISSGGMIGGLIYVPTPPTGEGTEANVIYGFSEYGNEPSGFINTVGLYNASSLMIRIVANNSNTPQLTVKTTIANIDAYPVSVQITGSLAAIFTFTREEDEVIGGETYFVYKSDANSSVFYPQTSTVSLIYDVIFPIGYLSPIGGAPQIPFNAIVQEDGTYVMIGDAYVIKE